MKIKKNNITFTQGDTLTVNVAITDADGEEILLEDSDELKTRDNIVTTLVNREKLIVEAEVE